MHYKKLCPAELHSFLKTTDNLRCCATFLPGKILLGPTKPPGQRMSALCSYCPNTVSAIAAALSCRRIASNVDVTLAIFSRDFVAQLYRATKSPYRYAAVTIAICNCNKSQETWFLHHCFLLILFQKLSAQLDSMR